MKKVFLFLVFTVIFSGLTGCGGSATNTQNTQVGETNRTAETNKPAKKSGDYPPIPAAIAQAEVRKIDDTTFKFEDKKGKVVLVNLWATWCGPCRAEMPHLVEFQNTYGDKGFEIVGLDIDPEPVEDIKEFAEEMKLNYQLGWAEKDLTMEFYRISQANAIPQSFLIDREGHLRGVFIGGSNKVITQMKDTIEKVTAE
jgi:thiol-disulfide isomerase/thioredoxin